MAERIARTTWMAGVAGVLLLGAGLTANVSHADVTPSGLGTLVNDSPAPAGVYNITGGARPDISPGNPGPNLFHSFGNFSLTAAEVANFVNTTPLINTTNILARVTSGNPSNIFGTIDSSSYGSANLFLMNPAGILFGPTARLNVAASFHATTADYISLNGTRFNAVPPAGVEVLSVEAPSAFGFLTSNPAPIDVQAGTFDFITTGYFSNVFQVPDGETLSFVGGTLNVGSPNLLPAGAPPAPGGFLLAPRGTINLVSVASPGEATFNSPINTNGFTQLGDINIKGGAIVDAKNVVIRGGRLAIQDATIYPGLFWLAGWVPPSFFPDGGGVDIQVANSVNITSVVGPILTFPGIETQAGSADDLVLGAVPNVSIDAGSVTISDGARILATRLGPGDPPSISITADTSVDIRNGSAVTIVNQFEGPGGTITVNAQDVTLDSGGAPGATGIQAQSNFHPAYGQAAFLYFPFFQLADSGSISVRADGQLTILNNAQISADSFAFGKSGSVNVSAGDMLLVGAGTNTAAITSQSGLGGDSGSVTVHADRTIDMQNGFRISANTFGSGTGGAVDVSAGQSITMTGQSTLISSQTDQPFDSDLAPFAQLFSAAAGIFIPDYPTLRGLLGIAPATGDLMQVLETLASPGFGGLVATSDFTPGDAGQVSVTAPLLSVNADAAIETSTLWDGNAGAIALTVGSLQLSNGGSVRSRSGGLRLDRGATAGTGNAGAITVTDADMISIAGRSPTSGEGSFVSTSTFGDGDAGNVTLTANQISVQNGGRVTSESGGTLGGAAVVGTGDGGNVTLTAANAITVSDSDSTVSTTTYGDGAGGNVTLSANQVNVQNGGQVTSESGGQLGGALTTGTGAGGIVTISAGNAVNVSGQDAVVSTSTFGNGDGGNISLNAGNSVQIANGGLVSADSLALVGAGTGLAGNINVTSGDSITMDSGTISTRAVTSDGGDIKLSAPGTVSLNNSQITTSVESGVGAGGNIGIDPQFVILNNSSIIANAFGGPGGNITIVADNFLASATSVIEASSALSTPGVIQIVSPDNNVESSIQALTAAFLDASSQLRGLCSARRTGAPSSFEVAGRGGVPVEADGYLPSFGTDAAAGLAGAAGAVRADAGGIGGAQLALVLPDSLNCMR